MKPFARVVFISGRGVGFSAPLLGDGRQIVNVVTKGEQGGANVEIRNGYPPGDAVRMGLQLAWIGLRAIVRNFVLYLGRREL